MNRLIVKGRQEGKTTDLINWAKNQTRTEARVIVSHTREQAMRLLRQHPEMSTWQFVSLEEVTHGGSTLLSGVRAQHGRVVFALDDLDLMLHGIFRGIEIDVVTVTDPALVPAYRR